ncbi:MAG TPA: ABC transporter ATP-binding protein [Acidimicrobiales bacterium]|nr:ABC transporter ATP-binding protein [Acidimicrobiales bacterium]
MTTAVATRGLVKRYGEHEALRGVDLQVPTGSVYGLVGPNGSGKTTLLSIVAGLRSATAGEIHLGVDRGRVAVLPDTPEFEPWLTGFEVVDLARRLTAPELGVDHVDAALADAGLADAAHRRVGGFSRGMTQRLAWAATVVGEPDLLLLDEPASALDPLGRREVLDLVAARRSRSTVVFSSHILADVAEVADVVGILHDGRLQAQAPLTDLLVGRAAPVLRVWVRDDPSPVADHLRAEAWVDHVSAGVTEGELRVAVRSVPEAERALPGALAAAGAAVRRIEQEAPDLETVFRELTS